MARKSNDTIRYNLYKLKKEVEDQIIQKIESVKLKLTGEKVIDGFKLSFYFSQQPEPVNIWWVDTYKEFFKESDAPQNLLYFAVLLISNDKLLYAISLGKSHFYLKPFCDSDFGLNLAERITDRTSEIKMKSSKHYKTAKSKIITTFQKGSLITLESGESMHYLKLNTLDEKSWGKIVAFGGSVQFTLPKLPSELPSLIMHIEEELAKPNRYEIPRAELVRDENLMIKLDKKLADAIHGKIKNSSISIDEISISGVDFIFSDRNYYSLFRRGQSRDKLELDDLAIEKLVIFSESRKIDLATEIDDILVYCENEYGKGHSTPVKYYLDYVDEDRYCLIDGKWHHFNLSYIKYLESEVDSLNIIYDSKYDIAIGIEEDQFNEQRASSDHYILLHKEPIMIEGKFKVEYADLYKKNTLFFVKSGSPQKLAYLIDQAMNTLAIFQNNTGVAMHSGEPITVTTFCLWMILARSTKITKLSEIKSIIFQMKLVEWKKAVINAGYKAEVRINYVL